MWNQVLEAAAANGIWALLSVSLLIYLLQDSRRREIKYQKTIESLAECLNSVKEVKEEVEDVKEDVQEIKADVRDIKDRALIERKFKSVRKEAVV